MADAQTERDQAIGLFKTVVQELCRKKREVQRLRAALKPFADLLEYSHPNAYDDWLVEVRTKHLRAARAALEDPKVEEA